MRKSESRRFRSGQAIFETAFVGSTNSSTEDLDEVDRIANHPLLRSSPELDYRHVRIGMRRSRSEMGGGSAERRFSSIAERSPQSWSGVGRSRPIMRGMSRSTTACTNLAQFTSPNHPPMVSRGMGAGLTSHNVGMVSRAKTPIRTRVTAIIETSGRQCVTPPPYPAPVTMAPCPTPPNTAPLPKKTVSPMTMDTHMISQFSSQSSCLSQTSMGQLSQKTGSSDSVSHKYSNSPSKPQPKPVLETHFGPMSEDFCYKASSPKNIPRGHTRFIERNYSKVSISACSSILSSMESMESNTSEGESVCESMTSSGVMSDMMTSSSSLETKHSNTRVSRLISKLQILSPISDKSQEQSRSPSEKESGTSPINDQSVNSNKGRSRRNLHLNFQEAEPTTPGSSLSFKNLRTPDIQQYLNVPWDIPKLKAKLKNKRNCFRGQSSSPETSPKKVVLKKSPDVEVILQSDCSKLDLRPSKHLNMKFEDYSAVKCNSQSSSSIKTPELEKFLEVPWEVPKLRKKIANRKKMKTLVNIQGSDSGISMSSQETKEICLGSSSWTGSRMSFKNRSHVYLSSQCGESDEAQKPEDGDSVSLRSNNDSSECGGRNSVSANSEFHFEFRKQRPPACLDIPNRQQQHYSSKVTVSQNNAPADDDTSKDGVDYKAAGGVSLVPISDQPGDKMVAVESSRPAEKPQLDLNSIQSSSQNSNNPDLSDLPFAMPKLQRRLQESHRLSLAILPSQQRDQTNLNLNFSNNNNNAPVKQSRPLSLHTGQLNITDQGFERNPSPAPGSLTHKSFKRKPLLFLTPSVNLTQSVSIDTSLPLENQEWYHGMMSRVEAENMLKTHTEGSYLLRTTLDSAASARKEKSDREYSLSIKSSRGFMHLRILRVGDGENISYKLGEFDKKFDSIVTMVHHYTINRLPIKGAEHMCLLTPVTEELL